MKKNIKILEAERFDDIGILLYCTCDDIQQKSKEEILDWFGDATKITLAEDQEIGFSIDSICPMISFSNVGAAMIKTDLNEVPKGVFPTVGIVE